MEISATEIKVLCNRINSSIEGYSVSGVYSMEEGMLLRLRHESKVEQLIAISSFATWLTKKNLSLAEAEPFVTRTRDLIERSRLTGVKQEGNERIATFKFASRAGEVRFLHAEFFGGGNLILADQREVIMDARKSERFRHRAIARGETFVMPPPRGIPLDQVTETLLSSELEKYLAETRSESNKRAEKSIAAIRWFGRTVGTSRKFVQEIFFRSNVSENKPASDLSLADIQILTKESSSLVGEIESSTKGYVLIPPENEESSGEESSVQVDVSPIVPNAWKVLVEKRFAKIENFESYSEALDQAQVQGYVLQTRLKASREVRRRVAELDSAIEKQAVEIEENNAKVASLRELASSLMQSENESVADSQEVTSKLESMGIVEKDPVRYGVSSFVTEPRSRMDSFRNERALASRLFDEAKEFSDQNVSLHRIKGELSEKRDELLRQASTTEERAEKRREFERRGKQWFERYRWFVTSDKHLAVGGRDATSNSIVINKYSTPGDIIFHTDIHGSPFFVLRGGTNVLSEKGEMNSEIELEVAQATASFSRAWKEDLSSADVYWINIDQVRKSAPSGEYLPRGSFFIEGKKNFVKHVKIELAVGIVSSQKLEALLSEQFGSEKVERESYPVVVCGPENSLSTYCSSYARIAPGKERSSSIARRLKQLLVSKSKEEAEFKDRIKKIAIDDIVRVLPSGSHKIVSQKQND